MEDTAMVLWIVTIAGGALLALLWLVHGGARRAADVDAPPSAAGTHTRREDRAGRSRIGVSVLANHGSLAVVGAILWGLFTLNTDDEAYKPLRWVAVALLVVTIALGLSMFGRWLGDRRRRHDGDGTERRPEQRLPALLVIFHGLAAAATLVVVVLALA
jgi:hypothetical protein